MNDRHVGTCSLCGGRVMLPSIWHGVVPPAPTCERCHATARQPEMPVMPMEPARKSAAMTLEELLAWSRTYVMTPEEREAQRRSFAYGNAHLANENVTREMIDAAAEKIARESSKAPAATATQDAPLKRDECGLCRKLGHSVKDCPKRRPARICRLCASLSHRVIGMRCKVCSLRFAPESNGDT